MMSMKKVLGYSMLGLLMAFSACTDKDDAEIADLNAPEISFAEGRASIRPMHGEVNPATKDHLHVRFSVRDESGIGQVLVDIHNSFDGHSHGRIMTEFEALNVKDIYSPDATNPVFRFPQGSTSLNVDGSGTDIYWGGPTSRVQGNVLAGPYDIVISAVDIHGNQTSFADDSNYIATFHIRTPYAPLVSVTNLEDGELEGEAGKALDVQGTIGKGEHSLSSDIKFVWVRLTEEHEEGHSHRVKDEDFYEKMWGVSTWREGKSGPALPSTSMLNLAEIFTGENAIILPEGEDHLELIIWVEDVKGNITEATYEVHID